MTSAKIRYAIGLLGDAEHLRRALEELARAGIPSSQLKVLVPEHALGEALAARRLPPVETWTVSRQSPTGAFPWCFEPIGDGDSTDPTDRVNLSGAEAMHGFHYWALQRHTQQLDEHLQAGGLIVLVHLLGDHEERTVCRNLLRNASGGVQTHEIPISHALAEISLHGT